MNKSRILKAVTLRCMRASGIGDEDALPLDFFIAAALRFLAENAGSEKATGTDNMEMIASNDVFVEFGPDYEKVATLLEKNSDPNEFMNVYAYQKAMKSVELFAGVGEENHPEALLNDVLYYAMNEPTELMLKYIFANKGAGNGAAEETPSLSDSEIEEIIKDSVGEVTGESSSDESSEDYYYDDDEDDEEEEEETLADVAKKAKDLNVRLMGKVFGQDTAVKTFVSGYFQAELTALTDPARFRPRATFLFAGPPGVGKTFLSEEAAAALKLPFKRFDMSEYSDKESNIEFAGSDKVYKNGSAGNVTSFVAENPRCILLFDEIEKAHLNVIHLFLQILDAGRLRDNYTDEEVSFTDAIIILTTNAGKGLYEDDSVNLATVSRKTVLKALSTDINPVTGAPMFPAAICSRFAYGNVVMFNRMGADNLLKIAETELKKQVKQIRKGTGVEIKCDPLLPYAVIYAEGGNVDARTIKGKSGSFIFKELYELLRLMQSDKNGYDVNRIEELEIKLRLPEDSEIMRLFKNSEKPGVLLFADESVYAGCKALAKSVNLYRADSRASADAILESRDVSLVLCDVTCGGKESESRVLNVEDYESEGREFLYATLNRGRVPVYVMQRSDWSISPEEYASLAALGVKGMIKAWEGEELESEVGKACEAAYQQSNLARLARANKVLSYQTLQTVEDGGKKATIVLFDFKLVTAVDAEDAKGVLDTLSRPNLKFDDVIGAKDAKDELNYFIRYLKNPVKYARSGVKTPKGILLYGPPGTGKTMLAKAMAGESDVTFIRAEGNQFLKKYVGEGSESVHALFAAARKYAPSILFIDEIDAIAHKRGDENGHSDDVLTSFLTEMDGFNTDRDRPVFVLAATNYDLDQDSARSLDSALLRRFDRRIYVDLPNRAERLEFIGLKLKGMTGHAVSDGERSNLADRSTGMSLADLDSVFELALRAMIKRDEDRLTDKMLEDAFETFNSGDEKKWSEEELLRTARHESGHALMCYAGGETPSYLTIVARGSHGGYMQHAEKENKGTYTKSELIKLVRTALGGRAAEVVYYGEEEGVSTGASGDLRSATSIIENMICSYGMDEVVGLGSVDIKQILHSPHYEKIASRVNGILAAEMAFVKQTIEKNRAAIDALVAALLEKNALKTDEIAEILKKHIK